MRTKLKCGALLRGKLLFAALAGLTLPLSGSRRIVPCRTASRRANSAASACR